MPCLPALQNGFIYGDDEYWRIDNNWNQAPLATRLTSSWSISFQGAYVPVTLMTLVLDRALWGVAPRGYHLTNLLLHGATAVAVYLLARQLIGSVLVQEGQAPRATINVGAIIAALSFAVHPLRAEPVSWVSARDTVLGGLLVVLATVVYLEGWKRGRVTGKVKSSWLWGSVLVFALALLARSTGLVLPAVLLLVDIYALRRLGGVVGWTGPVVNHVWLEKIPFLVLAAAIVPIAVWARAGVPVPPVFREGWSAIHAGAIGTYTTGWSVAAMIVPVDLAPLYDMPNRTRLTGYVAAALTVSALTALGIAVRARWPSVLTAWAAFGVLLFPVSGAVSGGYLAGPQDRYTYLPGVVAGLLAGGVAAVVWSRYINAEISFRSLVVVTLIAVAVLGTWGVLTWQQCGVWRDSVALWKRGVQIAPRNVVARYLYAEVLGREDDLKGALEQYRQLVPLWPTSVLVRAKLGYTLLALGRFSEAETAFRDAVDAAPNESYARLGLGRVLAARGMVLEALEQFDQALRSDPRSPEAHLLLGQTLARVNRIDEANEHVRQALALRPDWPAAETLRATLDRMRSGTASTVPRP